MEEFITISSYGGIHSFHKLSLVEWRCLWPRPVSVRIVWYSSGKFVWCVNLPLILSADRTCDVRTNGCTGRCRASSRASAPPSQRRPSRAALSFASAFSRRWFASSFWALISSLGQQLSGIRNPETQRVGSWTHDVGSNFNWFWGEHLVGIQTIFLKTVNKKIIKNLDLSGPCFACTVQQKLEFVA